MVTLGDIAAKKFLPLQVDIYFEFFDAGIAKAKLLSAEEITGQDAVRLRPWASPARRCQ
ncbi:unnamed protein product [Spirodela intermedia]|uniref:Uncharacterized protein n=1 Tax=Spirodela intermedia TaxID=51605 RepID=A0ABN7ED78_SPIIN|nr:unnamed protein product [Spirodela intermedia]